MRIYLFVFLGLMIPAAGALGQTGLQITGTVEEILSSEDRNLRGVLYEPRFAPAAGGDIFSLVRQLEDNRHLYICDLNRSGLEEIITHRPETDLTISGDMEPLLIFNDQLDWRPRENSLDRQWFVFVSSGAEENHDIYIGYIGGETYLRLTNDPAVDNAPRWSPDGNTIAFVSGRSGNGDIYLLRNMDRVLKKMDPAAAELVQLSNGPREELDPAWNPNPASYLMAYAARERFISEGGEAFQIKVLDLKNPAGEPLSVTRDYARHYTRPLWNPYNDSQLLFVGQGITEGASANLYLASFQWDENAAPASHLMEGYNLELFKDVRLGGTITRWLTGGQAVLCQTDRADQQYPLYSVNLDRWQRRRGRASTSLADLHQQQQGISGFDIQGNLLLFSRQEGKFFKIFVARLAGDDLSGSTFPQWRLNRPGGGKSLFKNPYVLAAIGGGALTTGIILSLGGGGNGEGATPQTVSIPEPPKMPDPDQ